MAALSYTNTRPLGFQIGLAAKHPVSTEEWLYSKTAPVVVKCFQSAVRGRGSRHYPGP